MIPLLRRIWPAALSTGMALCILISLGVWQLHRRAWKAAILADIERAEHSPPIPLPASGTPPRFSVVAVSGRLEGQAALYGSDVRDQPDGQSLLGAQRVQVLRRPDGRPVLVDLGWVPTEGGAPPVASGPTVITGYVRPADRPGLLSGEDDPGQKRFYTLDPPTIGRALGAPDVADFTLVALGKPGEEALPAPATELPRPPDNHLQYAFTWFGLGAALIGVFMAYVRRQMDELGAVSNRPSLR